MELSDVIAGDVDLLLSEFGEECVYTPKGTADHLLVLAYVTSSPTMSRTAGVGGFRGAGPQQTAPRSWWLMAPARRPAEAGDGAVGSLGGVTQLQTDDVFTVPARWLGRPGNTVQVRVRGNIERPSGGFHWWCEVEA